MSTAGCKKYMPAPPPQLRVSILFSTPKNGSRRALPKEGYASSLHHLLDRPNRMLRAVLELWSRNRPYPGPKLRFQQTPLRSPAAVGGYFAQPLAHTIGHSSARGDPAHSLLATRSFQRLGPPRKQLRSNPRCTDCD